MKSFSFVLLLVASLILLGCGNPTSSSRSLEGTWTVALTPTVGTSKPMEFNMTVLINPDSSAYVSNVFMTVSNGCLGTNGATETIGFDPSSKAVSMYMHDSSSGVTLAGNLMSDGETATGNYGINGSATTCQGGGMFTMTKIPNPGPNRGGK